MSYCENTGNVKVLGFRLPEMEHEQFAVDEGSRTYFNEVGIKLAADVSRWLVKKNDNKWMSCEQHDMVPWLSAGESQWQSLCFFETTVVTFYHGVSEQLLHVLPSLPTCPYEWILEWNEVKSSSCNWGYTRRSNPRNHHQVFLLNGTNSAVTRTHFPFSDLHNEAIANVSLQAAKQK